MATVIIQKRKRKSRNSYVIHYKDPSTHRTKYYKTFQRQKDAQQAVHHLRALIDTSRIPEIEDSKVKLTPLTFKEVTDLLKEEWKNRLEKSDISQKTHDEYLYRVNVLNRIFGRYLLSELTEDDIRSYQKQTKSEFSAVTSNRALFILKQVFKHGLRVKAIASDPISDISYLSEKEHERNRFLLPAELDNLLEASQKTRAKFYMPALIFLGAEHGASRQEALSLRWKDVNFDYEQRGTIRLFRTKNNKERTEYLMPRTKEALLSWRERQKWMRHRKRIDANGSDLVFRRLNGEPIKRFDKAWRATCEIAGLNDFHFHDLRHTFCSNLLLSGSDLKDVKEIIGHSDLSMTDRYSHLTLSHKQLRQDMLAEHYANGR